MIDTHCHLDENKLILKADQIETSVEKIIIPAIDSTRMKKMVALATKENIFFASGNHPTRTECFDEKAIENLLTHKKCVAVGECGIDLYRKKDFLIQADQLQKQIDFAHKYEKPLIIHSREADNQTYEILKNTSCGGVIHSYIGSKILLKLVDQGFYFGINGILTYPTATELKESLKHIPLERIVIETDAPYLSPQAVKREINQPAHMKYVLQEMSKILGLSVEELDVITSVNAKKLFKV